jgi:hypothetical protein
MKVVTGGQTGVDRAAMDVALEFGLPIGGWCPRGRLAEDGQIPTRYPLFETRTSEPHVRAQRNVEGSTATMIITRGAPIGGTRFTFEVARSMRRPVLVLDLANPFSENVARAVEWLDEVQPLVLNVAGPKESGAPGIADQTKKLLTAVLRRAVPRERPAAVA